MWIFNLFRFLLFWAATHGDPTAAKVYAEYAAQTPCMVYMPGWGNEDPASPPPCFYEVK